MIGQPLMRKLKRAVQLTLSDWSYLATATAELLIARIRFSAVATEKILRGLQAPLSSPPRYPKNPLSSSDVERLSWAIAVASSHVPWYSDCLIKTMAANRWLRRHDLRADFYLGVAKDEQDVFAAHAWLRHGDLTVAGGRYDRFSTLIEPKDHMHNIIAWQGLELVIRPNTVDQANLDWMGNSLFWRTFEATDMDPDGVVLDLGAHIGSFAVLAASRKPCRVFAFEPDLESLTLCKINVLLNSVDSKVECLRAAVAGRSGRVVLYEAEENWGHTTLQQGGPYNTLTGRKVAVDCYSLADALAHVGCRSCAFLKFNIEGAEFEMIEKSRADTLRRIRFMVGEIHYDLLRGTDCMLSRLHDSGFKVELVPTSDRRAILLAMQQ